MRLPLGMLRPNGGTAEVLGCPVADADRAVWSRVGHLIETPPRYGELTVAESVYSAARLQGWDRRPARVAAAAIITDLELDHWQHRATRTLSLGNRQRLGIAMALLRRPNVLVLDEPSNSLDPLGVVRVHQLLRTRASEDGVSVLVSSQHLDEVARMADRIVLLHHGQILGGLDPQRADVEHQFFRVKREAQVRHDKSRSLKSLTSATDACQRPGVQSPSRRLAAVTRSVDLSNIGCYLARPVKKASKSAPPPSRSR
jgi:ABC-2 type transport system ATP-binding protein